MEKMEMKRICKDIARRYKLTPKEERDIYISSVREEILVHKYYIDMQ
jgi:hypothetical protein